MTPASVTSTPDNGNPAHTSHSSLPSPLESGGLVDQLLGEARQQGRALNDWRLADTVRNDLDAVRRGFQCQDAAELNRILQSIDALFWICLAPVCGWQTTMQQYHKAFEAYSAQHADYIAVLGRLIPERFLDWAERERSQKAYRDGTNTTALEDWDVFLEGLNDEAQSDGVGLCCKSDLPSLDEAIHVLDGLNFIAGYKGVGKSTLLLSIAHCLLQADPELAVLHYTLENGMSKTRMLERLLVREANVPARILKSKHRDNEVEACIQAGVENAKKVLSRIRFIERFSIKQDIKNGKSWDRVLIGDTNRIRQSTLAKKVMVIIDNFQRMDVPNKVYASADDQAGIRLSTDSAKDDFRLDAIQQFCETMRTSFQPNGPAVLVASEITKREGIRRSGGQTRELTIDDLRGSGRLGSDAKVILLMWHENEIFNGAETVSVKFRIEKGRDGDIRKDFSANFHHTLSTFSESYKASSVKAPRKEPQKTRKTGGALVVDPFADD